MNIDSSRCFLWKQNRLHDAGHFISIAPYIILFYKIVSCKRDTILGHFFLTSRIPTGICRVKLLMKAYKINNNRIISSFALIPSTFWDCFYRLLVATILAIPNQ